MSGGGEHVEPVPQHPTDPLEPVVTLEFLKGFPSLRTAFGIVRQPGDRLSDVPRQSAEDLMRIRCFKIVTAKGKTVAAEAKVPRKKGT